MKRGRKPGTKLTTEHRAKLTAHWAAYKLTHGPRPISAAAIAASHTPEACAKRAASVTATVTLKKQKHLELKERVIRLEAQLWAIGLEPVE